MDRNMAWMLMMALLASPPGAAVGKEDAQPVERAAKAEAPASTAQDRKAEELAERFQVSPQEILDMRKKGLGWGEINHALSIAGKSGKPLAEVLSLRESGLGWGEIAKRYGFKLGETAGKSEAKEKTEQKSFPPKMKRGGREKMERGLRDAPNDAERGLGEKGRRDKTERGWGRGGIRR